MTQCQTGGSTCPERRELFFMPELLSYRPWLITLEAEICIVHIRNLGMTFAVGTFLFLPDIKIWSKK